MQTNENKEPITYLGDAVYARYDGYHVLLTLNNHENPNTIALEPDVIIALNNFVKQITELQKNKKK